MAPSPPCLPNNRPASPPRKNPPVTSSSAAATAPVASVLGRAAGRRDTWVNKHQMLRRLPRRGGVGWGSAPGALRGRAVLQIFKGAAGCESPIWRVDGGPPRWGLILLLRVWPAREKLLDGRRRSTSCSEHLCCDTGEVFSHAALIPNPSSLQRLHSSSVSHIKLNVKPQSDSQTLFQCSVCVLPARQREPQSQVGSQNCSAEKNSSPFSRPTIFPHCFLVDLSRKSCGLQRRPEKSAPGRRHTMLPLPTLQKHLDEWSRTLGAALRNVRRSAFSTS